MINPKCKLPDHLLITETVKSFEQIEEKVETRYPKAMKSKKYKLAKVDHSFMNDDHNQRLLNELINEILVLKEQQNDIDTLYAKFHSIVIQEMTNKLCLITGRHKRKHRKQCWNETLNRLWKDMRSKEKYLSKYKGPLHIRKTMKEVYKIASRLFHKSLWN